MKNKVIIILITVLIGISVVYFFTRPKQVELDTKEDAVAKFEDHETFIMVIGESTCTSCADYKESTLKDYVNKYSQDDLVFLYKDKSFSNTTEFYEFLNTYGLEFTGSPTTYYIKNGVFKAKFDDLRDLKGLEKFIQDNKLVELNGKQTTSLLLY